jgi:hypothetical protein
MKHCVYALAFLLCCTVNLAGQTDIDKRLPVRGLSIAAPSTGGLELFLKFISEELAPAGFNLLILRVDYGYAYKSHPELRSDRFLSEDDVKRIVAVCRSGGIRIAPQLNLFGHQSWASSIGNLLREYPEFDETPHVKLPEKYEWPNADGLYCKSYCPLHPDVHKIVFALMDELMDVFETDLFHAGMDEVFYIGDSKCPRCGGRDEAELFAGEVTRLRNHLAQRNGRLYIWGDRLIDGKTTGIGEWEASMNRTFRAIDLIPKDVFICDWHYDHAVPASVYFAMKGFDVAVCPWRKSDVAVEEVKDMLRFRQNSPEPMAQRFRGVIQTVWSGAEAFLKAYYEDDAGKKEDSEVKCMKRIRELLWNYEL